MAKRKVLIAVHQLNIGGVQKAVLSALDAIDYTCNDVTLYVRKNRCDLLPLVNRNVSVVVNKDKTKYYRKPYAIYLQMMLKLCSLLKKDKSEIQKKLNEFVISQQMKYEKEHYFSDNKEYDIAVSYIQSHTAKFVCDNVNAKKKVMFYHGSTDEFHDVNEYVMKRVSKVYCVSDGAMQAIKGFYPQFADKVDYVENFVDYKKIRQDAVAFVPPYKEDRLTLCTCGRMTSVKGYDLAVKAAKILKDSGLSFEWYFVGDGVERTKTEQMIADNGLKDNVVITGIVTNPYVYVKNADIYVQPSYEEAHCLSLIESQILGRLTVTTATVGGQVVVTDGVDGVVSDISAESLAEKIMVLVKDKDLQNIIKENLDKKDYDEDYRIFCDKWKKILED